MVRKLTELYSSFHCGIRKKNTHKHQLPSILVQTLQKARAYSGVRQIFFNTYQKACKRTLEYAWGIARAPGARSTSLKIKFQASQKPWKLKIKFQASQKPVEIKPFQLF